MRIFIVLLTLLLSLFSASLARAEPTVAALLERHARAVGPVDQVQTRRLRLRVQGIMPADLPVLIEGRRPNLIRKEVSLQGAVQVSVFDGKSSW